MEINNFRCDECPTLKGDSNHWFKFISYPDEGKGAKFTVTDWNSKGIRRRKAKHLCSDGCVVKAVQGWLSAQKEASQKEVIQNGESNVG